MFDYVKEKYAYGREIFHFVKEKYSPDGEEKYAFGREMLPKGKRIFE